MKASTQKSATEPTVHILKSAICSSLSGKSRLTYQLGRADGGGLAVRIVTNSGSGSVTRNWIDVEAIKSALDKAPRGAPITSDVLGPMFRGSSTNNRLFLFAILVHEGIVRRAGGDKRGYELAEFGAFAERTRTLIEGKGATTGADARTKKTKSKTGAKTGRPTVSRKKQHPPS